MMLRAVLFIGIDTFSANATAVYVGLAVIFTPKASAGSTI